MTKFHPRQQGDLGEATAIQWLTSIGAIVAFPLFHSPDYDLIADLGRCLFRIQVKTSSCRHVSTGHFAVQLATSGGNQSWNRVVKKFDSSRFDYLFALVEDGRKWFIPSSEIGASHQISLGGEKYSEFQLGHPDDPRSTLPGRRGGAGVGEPGRTVNPMALPEWVRFPPPPPPPRAGSAVGRTKMSKHHQVAVPRAVAAASAIKPGDRFHVESEGTGRFLMTRVEEHMEQQIDQLALPDGEDS